MSKFLTFDDTFGPEGSVISGENFYRIDGPYTLTFPYHYVSDKEEWLNRMKVPKILTQDDLAARAKIFMEWFVGDTRLYGVRAYCSAMIVPDEKMSFMIAEEGQEFEIGMHELFRKIFLIHSIDYEPRRCEIIRDMDELKTQLIFAQVYNGKFRPEPDFGRPMNKSKIK